MTVAEIEKELSAKALNIADGERKVTSGYAGDFLSFVMGRAPADCVWLTVMTNVNVLAVAALADVAVVVVCEDCPVDEAFLKKAQEKEINVLSTPLDVFSAVKRIAL